MGLLEISGDDERIIATTMILMDMLYASITKVHSADWGLGL